MTKQERLDILAELTQRLDKIIELLEVRKNNSEPLLTFSKANNVNNTFIEDRQKEIFSLLDCKEGE